MAVFYTVLGWLIAVPMIIAFHFALYHWRIHRALKIAHDYKTTRDRKAGKAL